MSRLNWDRERRQTLVARSWDYTARMDAAESMLWDSAPGRKKRKPTGKLSKSERRRRDAAALGITEAQLLRRRREAAQAEQWLAAEARRRGIKVKALRRMIERGEATAPTPRMSRALKPSGQIIVSSRRHTRVGGTGRTTSTPPSVSPSGSKSSRIKTTKRKAKRHPVLDGRAVSGGRIRAKTRIATCGACESPISPNGRCGCS